MFLFVSVLYDCDLQFGPRYDYHQPIKKAQHVRFQCTWQICVTTSPALSYIHLFYINNSYSLLNISIFNGTPDLVIALERRAGCGQKSSRDQTGCVFYQLPFPKEQRNRFHFIPWQKEEEKKKELFFSLKFI